MKRYTKIESWIRDYVPQSYQSSILARLNGECYFHRKDSQKELLNELNEFMQTEDIDNGKDLYKKINRWKNAKLKQLRKKT